jgi:hypothetical protein
LATPHRRHISKAAARGHKKGVADHCFADKEIKSYVIRKCCRLIHAEIVSMCSCKVNSVLQNQSNEAIKSFKWSTFIEELKANAPILYEVMLACTKTRQPRGNRPGVIAMCVAILLKHRLSRMSLIHKIIGLILYAGHTEKQVKMISVSTFYLI